MAYLNMNLLQYDKKKKNILIITFKPHLSFVYKKKKNGTMMQFINFTIRDQGS